MGIKMPAEVSNREIEILAINESVVFLFCFLHNFLLRLWDEACLTMAVWSLFSSTESVISVEVVGLHRALLGY